MAVFFKASRKVDIDHSKINTWTTFSERYSDARSIKKVKNELGFTWVEGDLLILPKVIYHRFTLDLNLYIKAMLIFQDDLFLICSHD